MASGVGAAATGIGVMSAAVSMVFGDLATTIDGVLDVVTFDAVVKEGFRTNSKVAEHPIETGAVIADHVTDEPDELQIEGIISNTPIMLVASARISSTYAEDEYSKLLRVKEAKNPVTVHTSKRPYEDYIITSIQRTREASLGDSVSVSVGLRRIRLATSKQGVQRPDGVQKPLNTLGRATKKAANPQQEKSLLLKASQSLFGLK